MALSWSLRTTDIDGDGCTPITDKALPTGCMSGPKVPLPKSMNNVQRICKNQNDLCDGEFNRALGIQQLVGFILFLR